MAITRTNLRSNLYNTIYTHLNTNLSDPESRLGKHWIFPSFPDTTVSNFIGYPLVVINNVEIEKVNELMDNSYTDITFPLEITIFSTKSSVLDTLSDSLDVAMAIQIDKSFNFVSYEENYDKLVINGDNVHYRIHKWEIEVDV